MANNYPILRLLARCSAIVGLTLVTASCAFFNNLDKDKTLDWSAEQLYKEARSSLDDGNWADARKYYTKLEARYPFGRLAQQAQVDLIYVNWKDGDNDQAILEADRFLQTYPGAENTDYVLWMKATALLNEQKGFMSFLLSTDRADQDPRAGLQAFDILKELVERYPTSRFASESRRLMRELVLAQAGHALQTAKFYYVRHAYVAAIDRAQTVVREFQNTPMRDEALIIIRNSYRALGLDDLALDTQRIIDMNPTPAEKNP